MKITAQSLPKLRQKIKEALAPVSKELGVGIEFGRATYARDGSSGSLKLELRAANADGTIEAQEVADFKKLAKLYGFEPADLGREFQFNNDRYKVAGLLPNAKKNTTTIERLRDGKKYVMAHSQVKFFLAKEVGDPPPRG